MDGIAGRGLVLAVNVRLSIGNVGINFMMNPTGMIDVWVPAACIVNVCSSWTELLMTILGMLLSLTMMNTTSGSYVNLAAGGACGVMTGGGGAFGGDSDLDPLTEVLNCAMDYHGIAGGGHVNAVGDDSGIPVDVHVVIAGGGRCNLVLGDCSMAVGGVSNLVCGS